MYEIKVDVFDKLRSWIIEGRFHEGQYINLGELCCSLKVSQVPVREVLIRLSERGLLTWERKRGFKIASCDPHECASILQMKRTIFTNAMNRLCPQHLSPDNLRNVRDRINSASSEDLSWAELSTL
ncbi:Transcriptional regulators|uniref:Regulatory GntR family protein n=1 Tax=Brenneria salicis ATCC 15712 = DSM 30166 TaxID=714314 RepID=A0A366I094_9GAMM|nr:Transcriptional regulators [Brenneria salicis ATCC 15712 = DSM 30166]RBP58786.1 regulatory GntR family protein [Brenneria salicis ATCC 15712 = DSM 30166]